MNCSSWSAASRAEGSVSWHSGAWYMVPGTRLAGALREGELPRGLSRRVSGMNGVMLTFVGH